MLFYLQASQNQEQTAIEQLATGLRVNVPSDDPAAAAANLVNDASSSRADDQYVQNIDSVQQTMTTADSTLSSVITELTQAISLGVEGSDGTLSSSDRQAIAQQVSGIKRSDIFAGEHVLRRGFICLEGRQRRRRRSLRIQAHPRA